jgi:hypothetical protein
MGAAFGVALVLIYVLVVWEFGNFRIPLVIMAPIPLTLLGIIPAHWLAFQLGMGGEFTATSMIGWIALAGIIVRNSILLVDFSIHEVQKGVPVTEAVIRSCKTRTRPIVITALALVAGSSVIFTDPIFQGMAISLSSGVLVSTVLTLIVIPLGCVAASKDLCEVAVASAPLGMTVPCAEGLVDPDPSRSSGAAAPGTASPARKRQQGSGGVLAKIGGGLMLLLYAFRGIFLLLFDVLKGLLAKKRKRPVAPGARSGPLPNALRHDDGDRDAQGTATTAAAEQKTSPTSQTVDAEPSTVIVEEEASESEGGTEVEAPTSDQPAAATQKTATAKKATAKKAAAKKTTSNKTTSKKTTAAKTTAKKTAAKVSKKATPQTTKKTARRGIRLKTDDSSDKAGDPGEQTDD